MYDLDIDSKLFTLLEGKKVAIVGPAAYLENSGLGEAIDSYDVVIRPNAFTVPQAARKDYGSRTDIMFHNMGTAWMSGLKEQVSASTADFKSLKLVVCPAIKAEHNENNFMQWPDTHESACSTNFNQVNKYNIPFWWVGVANYKKMYRTIGCEPYTGIMSVLISSDCYPQELFLTGFDFYLGSKVYHEGYLASVDSSQETNNRGGGHGSPCTSKNKEYIKRWIIDAPFAKTDEHIRDLLF